MPRVASWAAQRAAAMAVYSAGMSGLPLVLVLVERMAVPKAAWWADLSGELQAARKAGRSVASLAVLMVDPMVDLLDDLWDE